MRFFDVHTHPNCEPLYHEFVTVYADCMEQHVAFNVVGNDLTDSQIAIEMTKMPNVVCTVGIHPNEIANYDLEVAREQLEQFLKNNDGKIVAIGECGLDFSRPGFDVEKQTAFFRMQIALAIKYQKTLMCHIRDAHEQALEILAEEHPERVIIHCFSADAFMAQKYLALGFYLSIPGIVTFKNAQPLREALHVIPLHRLLVETDAPFLTPVPYRGKTNYPYFVRLTLEKIASELGMNLATLSEQTWHNAHQALNILEDKTWK